MKTKLICALAVLALTAVSAAQEGAASALQGSLVDAMGLPGQGWTSIGNVSPIEHNNFYIQSYVEQSAAVFATYSGAITVTPFVGLGLVLDTKGYEWNNKANVGGGIKAVIPGGEVYTEIGAAYLHETRFESGQSAGGISLFTNFSFNWNLLGRKAGR